MILSNKSIQKLISEDKLIITPSCELKESSVKLHFSEKIILKPKSFTLSKTLEKIKMSKGFVGLYDSYAKLAQMGITTHLGSMLVDSDTDGQLTLEIYNFTDTEIVIRKEDRCGQLVLIETK